MWGARSPTNLFFFKFLLSPEGKNKKSIISQKLKIAQENQEEIRGKEEREEKEEKEEK